jgi:hypothetical protein
MSDDVPTTAEIIAAGMQGTVAGLTEPVVRFLAKLLGPATGQVGDWLGEVVADKRRRWRERVVGRAQEIVEASGLEVHEVPLQLLMPILDSGSNEERPEMQERWAYLLANAATGANPVHTAFPEILRQLEPIEARAVEFMVVEANGWTGTARLLGDAVSGLDNGNIDNLVRLALARVLAEDYTGPGAQIRLPEPTLVTTVLAMRFVAACRAPGAAS